MKSISIGKNNANNNMVVRNHIQDVTEITSRNYCAMFAHRRFDKLGITRSVLSCQILIMHSSDEHSEYLNHIFGIDSS